jgi:adenine-specific DNA-methyltransferase
LKVLDSSQISGTYNPDASIVLYAGDVRDLLATVPSNTVRLIITSPPYNLGKEYETRVELKTYLKKQAEIIKELVRVLADDGSICWQVGNYIEKGEVYPLDIYYYDILKDLGLYLRNRIIWHFGHGLHARKRFSGRYETILWFTKSDEYIFNLDPVRVESKYPGKRHYKGPNRGKPSGNPKGKNPSDFWADIVSSEFDEGIIDIPNVKANHPEKTIHPCQFPVELVERCVLAMTNEGDWVFDPFAGVGSSLIAAIRRNRKAMGAEWENTYIETIRERLRLFSLGELQIRPLGKPVYKPSGNEKISQVPDEWKKRQESFFD